MNGKNELLQAILKTIKLDLGYLSKNNVFFLTVAKKIEQININMLLVLENNYLNQIFLK